MARLFAIGRSGAVGSQTSAQNLIATTDPEEVQERDRARESLIETNRYQNAGQLDAVAGGEFVDDRIRLGE